MSNGVIHRDIAIKAIEQDITSERPSYYAIIPADVRYDKELTPNAKLLYGEITALCGKDGRCWAENRYFADLYGVSKTSISKWIKALSDKGYISCELVYKKGTKEIERRYIRIVSYPIEEKLKENNTRFNTTRENNIKRIYISEFSELWTLYPNKKGKEKALSAYIKARESGTEKETVEKGIKDYAKECELKGREKDYIKYGSTWFNQHGWEDEYDLTPARKISPAKQAYSRKDDTDLTGIL